MARSPDGTCWGCLHLEVDTTPQPNREMTKSWWRRFWGPLDIFPHISYLCWAKEARNLMGAPLGRPLHMLGLWATEGDNGHLDCPRQCADWEPKDPPFRPHTGPSPYDASVRRGQQTRHRGPRSPYDCSWRP